MNRVKVQRIGLLLIGALLIAVLVAAAGYSYWSVFNHRFLAITDDKVYQSRAMPIEALENMGINISDYLVAPRIIGTAISQLAITVYFTVIALLTGIFISTVFVNTAHLDFIAKIGDSFTPYFIAIFVIKNIIFGFVIGTVACYNALRVKGSATELPQRTTASIVQSLSFLFVIDSLLTFAIFI